VVARRKAKAVSADREPLERAAFYFEKGERMKNAWIRFLVRMEHWLMRKLYPNDEDRMCAYFGEATTLSEIIQMREGTVLKSITITPDEDGGYHIHQETNEEVGV
jgi:hypothetical protein